MAIIGNLIWLLFNDMHTWFGKSLTTLAHISCNMRKTKMGIQS